MPRKKIQNKSEYGRGSVYAREDRGTWCVSYRDADGRHTETGFASKPEAKKRLAVLLGEQAAGKRKPKSPAKLGELAEKWLTAREADPDRTSAYDDRKRWELHLAPLIGHMRPDAVTVATIKTIIASVKAKNLSPATAKLVIALLSSLYSDLAEDGHAPTNPCKSLSKKTRAELRSAHDPKRTPYLHDMADVVRLYQGLKAKSESVATAYVLGALAGLRTGEARALDWAHVDLALGNIHVQATVAADGGVGALKDRESRIVPIQPSLAAILEALPSKVGPVCPPIRQGSRRFLDDHTMGKYLREVVADLGLEMACECCGTRAAWYEYSRHVYGCQFILAGGTMSELSRTMGHSSSAVTERHYVHLLPGYYQAETRNLMTADFCTLATELATGEDGGVVQNTRKAS